MKVVPNIQIDAILYYIKTRLRTDPELLKHTEDKNPDEICHGFFNYIPFSVNEQFNTVDTGGLEIHTNQIPAIALVPQKSKHHFDAHLPQVETTYDLYYIFMTPRGDDTEEASYTGEEKASRWNSLVAWRLIEYMHYGRIRVGNTTQFDLLSEGKLKRIELGPITYFTLASMVSGFKAVVTAEYQYAPYTQLDPPTMERIRLELNPDQGLDLVSTVELTEDE
jgi:hypothetical protein